MLSPYLFAIYVDNVITTVEHKRLGCLYKSVCVSIIMYALQMTLFCCRHLLQLYKNCYMSANGYFKT